ncbi:MAG: hypothetical protein QXP03_06300 [Desulfurococcaceae archaeon]
MGITLRYIPIPPRPEGAPYWEHGYNATAETTSATMEPNIVTSYEQLLAHSRNVWLLVCLVLVSVMGVLLALMVLRSSPLGGAIQLRGLVDHSERYFEKALYQYAGLKRVLRDVFLKVRKKLNAGNKTPREMAGMDRKLEKFAEMYEDVVYGDKERGEALSVVNAVKRVFGIEE